jgi:hypothetical protein
MKLHAARVYNSHEASFIVSTKTYGAFKNLHLILVKWALSTVFLCSKRNEEAHYSQKLTLHGLISFFHECNTNLPEGPEAKRQLQDLN